MLDNAVKYAPSGSLVRVSAEQRKDGVEIDVADEGVGIAADELPRVFDSFFRASRGDRVASGTGLGLAIARGLVEAHGRPHLRPQSPARLRTRGHAGDRDHHPSAGRTVMSASRSSILVIDDEPQIHRFLRPALEAAGYRVERADTAAEGLRLAASRAPDAVLLDLGLPDADGHDVLARLRAFSDVPVIVLSARDRESEKIAALDGGADDYVEKPFAVGELLARIRTALRHRRAGDGVPEMVRLPGLDVDLEHRQVRLAGETAPLSLSPLEWDLLAVLARNAGRVLTHAPVADGRLGTGACPRRPVSAGVRRPTPPQDRAGRRPDRDRSGRRLPAHGRHAVDVEHPRPLTPGPTARGPSLTLIFCNLLASIFANRQ